MILEIFVKYCSRAITKNEIGIKTCGFASMETANQKGQAGCSQLPTSSIRTGQ